MELLFLQIQRGGAGGGGRDGERQRERLCLPQPSFNYSADI